MSDNKSENTRDWDSVAKCLANMHKILYLRIQKNKARVCPGFPQRQIPTPSVLIEFSKVGTMLIPTSKTGKLKTGEINSATGPKAHTKQGEKGVRAWMHFGAECRLQWE